MSLRNTIDATYKEPSATVKSNGNRLRNVLSVELSASINDSLASVTVSCSSKPSTRPESKLQVYQGYNREEMLTFTGYVDAVEFNEADQVWTIQARDVLKKALDTFLVQEVRFGIDPETQTYEYSTYSSNDGGTFVVHSYSSLAALNAAHPETTGNYSAEGVYAHAVVQWLLVMCGFAEGSEIQVDDTQFWIGDLSPAKFHLTSVYDAINQIGNLIGWHVVADVAGVVRFKQRPRNPSAYVAWAYNSTSNPPNVHEVSRMETNTDLRNYVEVRGASGIRTVVRGPSPYIGNTPYRGVLISDELIDTSGIATFIANRVFNDLNRLKVAVSLGADGNPYVQPGSTVQLRTQEATGKFLVESIQTSVSSDEGYRLQAALAQYPGDPSEGIEPEPTIEALFVATDFISIGDPTYLIRLDASSSYSTRGQIVQYTWEFPNAPTYVSDSPHVWWAVKDTVLDAGTVVTLTVVDEINQMDTLASGVSTATLLSGQRPKYRHLYAALTTRAVGSTDGFVTAVEQEVPAISVAASNFGPGGVATTSGYALFGGSNGTIYRTIDGNITLSGIFSAGSSVRALHVPEQNSTYALAGCEDGKVYQSTNQGVSWTLLYDFPVPIRDLRYAYDNFTYILVVGAGLNNVWESYDGGATFIQRSYGIDATKETSGVQTNYFAATDGFYVMSGGAAAPLAFAGSETPHVVAATTMIDRDDGNMIVDTTGQHWVFSGGQFNETQYNGDNLTRHMIRDGEVPIVTYYATQSGVSKSLDRNETIAELYYPTGTMPGSGWGQMVAYGPLTTPITPGRLFIYGTRPENSDPFSPTTGLFVANAAGSWTPVTGETTTSVVYSQATVTPGFIAFPRVSASVASYVALVAVQASGFTYNPTWFDANNWKGHDNTANVTVVTAEFSKIPASYGDMHLLLTDLQDDAFATVQGQRWGTVNNFTLAPSGFFEHKGGAILHDGIRTHVPKVSRTALNDTLVGEFEQGLFDAKVVWINLNLSTGASWQHMTNTAAGEDSEFPKWYLTDNEAKFMPAWYTYARYNLGYPEEAGDKSPYGLMSSWTTAGIETIPSVANRDTWNQVRTEGSFQYSDAVYFLDSGVLYRVDKYGHGDVQTIYTPPPGLEAYQFSVTPGPGLRTDCIALLVADTGVETTTYTYYSTDAGETWQAGPIVEEPTSTSVYVWYVSETEAEV